MGKISQAEIASNAALLVVYGAVMSFFVWRFLKNRAPPSLGVALLPSGWIAFVLRDMGALDRSAWVQWTGVLFGSTLLYLVMRAEANDERERRARK